MSAVDTGLRRNDDLHKHEDFEMPDLLLPMVPQWVVRALEQRGALHGRSAEDEHRLILQQALCDGFWERAAALREETRGRISTPSEVLIRQDRDEH